MQRKPTSRFIFAWMDVTNAAAYVGQSWGRTMIDKPEIWYVNPKYLTPGPIRHESLTDEQTETIRQIYEILSPYLNTSSEHVFQAVRVELPAGLASRTRDPHLDADCQCPSTVSSRLPLCH
jgi:hypothetical protein